MNQVEGYTTAIVETVAGPCLATGRSLELNPTTGQAHNLMPGVEYVPLTESHVEQLGLPDSLQNSRRINIPDGPKLVVGGQALKIWFARARN